MTQIPIKCWFMRGGSSRGPFFRANDLPEHRDEIADILIKIIGAGNSLNIDGMGGGTAVTTKTAMLSKSDDEWADIDYFFAQVQVLEKSVDFKPTCGNIASAVGSAAIEMGLVAPEDGETRVKIKAVNTGARIEAVVQTPNKVVKYDGDAKIDGVPGSAAPVILNFMDVVGSKTSGLLPTSKPFDLINGYRVTCIDVAVPMVLAAASEFGITGYESCEEINENKELFAKIEAVRIKAGEAMGLKDVGNSVVPKFGLLSKPKNGGSINARYFMPWKCHPTMAVTGAICIGSSTQVPGSVGYDLVTKTDNNKPAIIKIEHPCGDMDVQIDCKNSGDSVDIISAGVLRTARLIMKGEAMLPSSA